MSTGTEDDNVLPGLPEDGRETLVSRQVMSSQRPIHLEASVMRLTMFELVFQNKEGRRENTLVGHHSGQLSEAVESLNSNSTFVT